MQPTTIKPRTFISLSYLYFASAYCLSPACCYTSFIVYTLVPLVFTETNTFVDTYVILLYSVDLTFFHCAKYNDIRHRFCISKPISLTHSSHFEYLTVYVRISDVKIILYSMPLAF